MSFVRYPSESKSPESLYGKTGRIPIFSSMFLISEQYDMLWASQFNFITWAQWKEYIWTINSFNWRSACFIGDFLDKLSEKCIFQTSVTVSPSFHLKIIPNQFLTSSISVWTGQNDPKSVTTEVFDITKFNYNLNSKNKENFDFHFYLTSFKKISNTWVFRTALLRLSKITRVTSKQYWNPLAIFSSVILIKLHQKASKLHKGCQ